MLHDFNSRPSARGDQTYIGYAWYEGISIHAPPRGATAYCLPFPVRMLFQFTPLREGRPVARVVLHRTGLISIHAPPRGATLSFRAAVMLALFQFTPLREGRLMLVLHCVTLQHISIHAPPRGATPAFCISSAEYRPFQFTPLREGRPIAADVGDSHE